MMKIVWKVVCNLLMAYGRFGAGAASVHGMHEAKVPMELQE